MLFSSSVLMLLTRRLARHVDYTHTHYRWAELEYLFSKENMFCSGWPALTDRHQCELD